MKTYIMINNTVERAKKERRYDLKRWWENN
jgi:hypothetical protein